LPSACNSPAIFLPSTCYLLAIYPAQLLQICLPSSCNLHAISLRSAYYLTAACLTSVLHLTV
jgi:hypothetical protein